MESFLTHPRGTCFQATCMVTVMVVLPTHPKGPVPPVGQNGAFGRGYWKLQLPAQVMAQLTYLGQDMVLTKMCYKLLTLYLNKD